MFLHNISGLVKQKRLVLALAFSAFALLSCGNGGVHQDIAMLENNKTYTVWETLHTFSDEGESDDLLPDNELIKSLPQPIKVIIAYYSTLIPDYMWNDDTSNAFAAALGDFPSLYHAQSKLLKGHNIRTAFSKGTPVSLDVKRVDDAIFFTCHRGWNNSVTDEFRISKNGVITYVEPPEKPLSSIQYNRAEILDRYYDNHTINLNGERVDLYYTYLDADNIKSVGIDEEEKVVYIEQKDKKPTYFSQADIDKSMLANPPENMDDVEVVILENGLNDGGKYCEWGTKIELSAIKQTLYFSDDKRQCVALVLK